MCLSLLSPLTKLTYHTPFIFYMSISLISPHKTYIPYSIHLLCVYLSYLPSQNLHPILQSSSMCLSLLSPLTKLTYHTPVIFYVSISLISPHKTYVPYSIHLLCVYLSYLPSQNLRTILQSSSMCLSLLSPLTKLTYHTPFIFYVSISLSYLPSQNLHPILQSSSVSISLISPHKTYVPYSSHLLCVYLSYLPSQNLRTILHSSSMCLSLLSPLTKLTYHTPVIFYVSISLISPHKTYIPYSIHLLCVYLSYLPSQNLRTILQSSSMCLSLLSPLTKLTYHTPVIFYVSISLISPHKTYVPYSIHLLCVYLSYLPSQNLRTILQSSSMCLSLLSPLAKLTSHTPFIFYVSISLISPHKTYVPYSSHLLCVYLSYLPSQNLRTILHSSSMCLSLLSPLTKLTYHTPFIFYESISLISPHKTYIPYSIHLLYVYLSYLPSQNLRTILHSSSMCLSLLSPLTKLTYHTPVIFYVSISLISPHKTYVPYSIHLLCVYLSYLPSQNVRTILHSSSMCLSLLSPLTKLTYHTPFIFYVSISLISPHKTYVPYSSHLLCVYLSYLPSQNLRTILQSSSICLSLLSPLTKLTYHTPVIFYVSISLISPHKTYVPYSIHLLCVYLSYLPSQNLRTILQSSSMCLSLLSPLTKLTSHTPFLTMSTRRLQMFQCTSTRGGFRVVTSDAIS